jgi:hypothetical protein
MRVTLLFLGAVIACYAAGPHPLFDGKTLNGWNQCNGNASYVVEDGALSGTTVKSSPNSFLCTTRDYANFVLELDEKNDAELNSGIQIRSHRYEKETDTMVNNKGMRPRHWPVGRVHGYQVEIANESALNSGGIFDEAGRGWLSENAAGSACAKAFHDNQWNHYKVMANGDHLQTWVNGVACADIHDSTEKTGFIALQVHEYNGPKPVHVWFKNIRIEELPAH